MPLTSAARTFVELSSGGATAVPTIAAFFKPSPGSVPLIYVNRCSAKWYACIPLAQEREEEVEFVRRLFLIIMEVCGEGRIRNTQNLLGIQCLLGR